MGQNRGQQEGRQVEVPDWLEASFQTALEMANEVFVAMMDEHSELAERVEGPWLEAEEDLEIIDDGLMGGKRCDANRGSATGDENGE